MGCSSWNCEQEEHQACSCLMRAPIPQSLAFLICEMGAGKGWKPRSGGALERGSEEKEAGVRARSSVGDQRSRGWDSGMLGTSLSNSSRIHKANLPLRRHQDLPFGGVGWRNQDPKQGSHQSGSQRALWDTVGIREG